MATMILRPRSREARLAALIKAARLAARRAAAQALREG